VTGHYYETGLGPLAAGVVNVVLNAGATGVAIWLMTPDDEELVKAAVESDPGCELPDPLTPGARAQALSSLGVWEDVAKDTLTGPRLGAALKTISNVRELLESDTDADGNPIGACHVRAAIVIVDRQIWLLREQSGGATEIPDANGASSPPGAHKPTTNWAAPAAVALVAAVALGAFFAWRVNR
jgi:hypothetical protein